MMEFQTEIVDGTSLVHLFHQGQKVLSLAPDQGAKLMDVLLPGAEEQRPLFWKVERSELGTNVFGKNDILFPFPNRTRNGIFNFRGQPYQFPINETENHHAIHGFVRNEKFEVLSTEVDNHRAKISLVHQSPGKSYFAFPFDFIVHYQWQVGGLFEVHFEIRNVGKKTLPFGLGWHPYFDLGIVEQESALVHLPATRFFESDAGHIPTGHTQDQDARQWQPQNAHFDGTYQILSTPISYGIETQHRKIEVTTSDNLDFLQIYIPAGKGVIALEPMSSGVDAMNNGIGLRELLPGKAFGSWVRIQVSSKY